MLIIILLDLPVSMLVKVLLIILDTVPHANNSSPTETENLNKTQPNPFKGLFALVAIYFFMKTFYCSTVCNAYSRTYIMQHEKLMRKTKWNENIISMKLK